MVVTFVWKVVAIALAKKATLYALGRVSSCQLDEALWQQL